MTRYEAIGRLVEADLAQLTAEDREELLLDYWRVNESDEGYDLLPRELRDEMAQQKDSPADATSAHYDQLLKLALRHKYVGVMNSFIQAALERLGESGIRVEGQVEPLATCPCCRYQTIEEPGEYDICKVCFWEDDGGPNDPSRLSGCNHMTLGEARENFRRFGAVSEEMRSWVLKDGPARYPRSESVE